MKLSNVERFSFDGSPVLDRLVDELGERFEEREQFVGGHVRGADGKLSSTPIIRAAIEYAYKHRDWKALTYGEANEYAQVYREHRDNLSRKASCYLTVRARVLLEEIAASLSQAAREGLDVGNTRNQATVPLIEIIVVALIFTLDELKKPPRERRRAVRRKKAEVK